MATVSVRYIVKRLRIEPQVHVVVEGEASLTVDHDRMIAEGTQVTPESVQGDMEAVAGNVGAASGQKTPPSASRPCGLERCSRR